MEANAPAQDPPRPPLALFLDFLKSTWGILSNVSVFFPFSGLLVDEAPVSAGLATLNSVLCAGVVLLLWVGRADTWVAELRGTIFRSAKIEGTVSLMLGAVLIFLFLFAAGVPEVPRAVVAGFYLAGFMMLTGAFTLFGLKEYLLTADDLGFDLSKIRYRLVSAHVDLLATRHLHLPHKSLSVNGVTTSADGIEFLLEHRPGAGSDPTRKWTVKLDRKGNLAGFDEVRVEGRLPGATGS